jgi:hypothetical protein
MPVSGRKSAAEPCAGTSPVVVTCGGRRCQALRHESATDTLRAAVRETSGAVLVGPLHRPADLHALAGWVREGGPATAPLPASLRDLQRHDLA